jgi:hypothetical protein
VAYLLRCLPAGGRQANGGQLFVALPVAGMPVFGGQDAATGPEYQYRLTQIVLAFTMSAPK